MIGSGKASIEWYRKTPLPASGVFILDCGTEVVDGGTPLMPIVDVRDTPFMRWGLKGSHNFSFVITGWMDQLGGGTGSTIITQAVTGATADAAPTTPIHLAAPYSGNNGWIILPLPYITISLLNTSATLHTHTWVWVQVWG